MCSFVPYCWASAQSVLSLKYQGFMDMEGGIA